jgi:hypothetical protein
MLRVNVGLSRKVSRDYNSTGFSINLDGEVTAPVSDPEAVVEQVKELFDLAEEALNREIERYQGESAIASRDEDPRPASNGSRNHGPRHRSPPSRGASYTNGSTRPPKSNGREDTEAATDKQISYLLTIGKRQRLSTVEVERRIEEILGQATGIYDLTKRDAAKVIDALNNPVGDEQAARN